MKYYVAENLSQIQPHIAAWQQLANLQEDDVLFSAPGFLLPLIQHYSLPPYRLLFIYSEDDTAQNNSMIAFAPFSIQPRKGIILHEHLSSLSHSHIGWAQPYIHPKRKSEAAEALVEWCFSMTYWPVVAMYDIYEESIFYQEIRKALRRRRSFMLVKTSQRAVMRWIGDSEKYIQKQLSAKKRKRLRNLNNRLNRKGAFQITTETSPEKLHSLLDQFMDLDENSSKSTSRASTTYADKDRQFLHDMADNFSKDHTLSFPIMTLDGKVIAMQFNIEVGRTFFAYKTAYDPVYQKFSPGTLLEVETMREFQRSNHLKLADSCTDPGSYIENLWKERKRVKTLIFPVSILGNCIFLITGFLNIIKSALASINADKNKF